MRCVACGGALMICCGLGGLRVAGFCVAVSARRLGQGLEGLKQEVCQAEKGFEVW